MSPLFIAVLLDAATRMPVGKATPTATASAASAATAATPTPTPGSAEGAEYRVGAGDVLDVTVFGYPDYSRTAAVQSNGTVVLPLLREVAVASLTIPEIKTKLTTLLARDYLQRPQVEVKVKEYQSQFIIVTGEVNTPGRKPLRGRMTVFDALTEAGGFSPNASGELVITRTDGSFSGGGKTLRLQLSGSAKDIVNLEVPLRNGDLITSSRKYHVSVDGEVARPGRFTLEPDLTVTGAISLAGGFTRFGSRKVTIRRVNAETHATEIHKVNIEDVQKGKKPDFPLQPGDTIIVGRKFL
jgi:polysaccharide biosynthesis/export protein